MQHQKQQTVPYLYIISGCNGAGKTTASFTILPEMLKCREFVNSDEIAKGLSPFNADSIAVAVEASRIMYKRIKELIGAGETFAMETTLATRSVANLIREAQREGYYVTLLYFWLNTPDLAVERVKMRDSRRRSQYSWKQRYGVDMRPVSTIYSSYTFLLVTIG